MENQFGGFFKEFIHHGLEMFGRYYSSYLGVVNSNEDPDNLNRLKLIIPTVTGNEVYDYWAWPKGNFAGKGYGLQLLPKKSDVVRVEFEHGDPKAPLWSHSHFAMNEKPNEPDLLDKNSYWLITPKGHRVVINDTKNYLIVQDAQGNKVTLNSTGIIQEVSSGKHIILGTPATDQAVLGNQLYNILEDLMEILMAATTLTALGPQPFLPDTQIKLTVLKAKLIKILSKTTKLK